MSVVTRFAPSPTGYLHIGGARTALFNWLFARHHGGRYLLRIEDTDKQRSTDDAIAAIHDGLAWLGLHGDEAAVSQSERADRHIEVANALLQNGAAYRCYLDAEELTALRDAAHAKGKPVRSPWRDKARSPDSAEDRPFVVRMRMPDTGEITIEDAVQGIVTVKNGQLDDMVILRADSSPTYMLAVVVDDHDMGITHVIRGDDHLNNAFRQVMVYRSMGWDVPIFAHIPLIHGADGAKLSKRHGALGVEAYRDMGFLPDAMVNYLMGLGWSYSEADLMGRADAITAFDLSRIGKSPARFDSDKLKDINSHYLRYMADDAVFAMLAPHIDATSPDAAARITALMPHLKDRAKTHLDIVDNIDYLLHDGAPSIREDAVDIIDETAQARLLAFADAVDDDATAMAWTPDLFYDFFKSYLAENGLKMKDMGLPLRVVVTGTRQSPSITDVLVVLGRDETVKRIRRQLQKIAT